MRNSPDFYIDLGRKAARAINQNDQVRASHHRANFDQAISQENGLDRKQAEILFVETYDSFNRTPVFRA